MKADEEMKKEQERRVTEDKKDSVHQQLLHTVCCPANNHKSPKIVNIFIFPLQKYTLLFINSYLIQVANSQFVMCCQFHKMDSVGVGHMKTFLPINTALLHIYGIHCVWLIIFLKSK